MEQQRINYKKETHQPFLREIPRYKSEKLFERKPSLPCIKAYSLKKSKSNLPEIKSNCSQTPEPCLIRDTSINYSHNGTIFGINPDSQESSTLNSLIQGTYHSSKINSKQNFFHSFIKDKWKENQACKRINSKLARLNRNYMIKLSVHSPFPIPSTNLPKSRLLESISQLSNSKTKLHESIPIIPKVPLIEKNTPIKSKEPKKITTSHSLPQKLRNYKPHFDVKIRHKPTQERKRSYSNIKLSSWDIE